MKQKPSIPVYRLHESGTRNFHLFTFDRDPGISHWDQAHRDDNYLLYFQRTGSITAAVDFQEIKISGCALFSILPGQVHHVVSMHGASAWALALDPVCLKDGHRTVLAEFAIRNRAIPVDAASGALFQQSFSLLGQLDQQDKESADDQTVNSMLDVCISMFIAACRKDPSQSASSALRPHLITRQFRSLLLLRFREMKRPSAYAAALNISPSYLNEVVKDTTGYPVSYWIHQEIMLEAKRMLFYTNSTVKEISYLLGYTDTPYFIRLFTKVAGMSPLRFRSNYRK